jgi:hypothetical protein
MPNDTAVPDTETFQQLVDAFAEADDREDRSLYLRALLRRLEVNLGRVARDLHVLIERTTEVKP